MMEAIDNKESEADVLLNTFLINKKRFHVLLHQNEIVWQKENSNTEKTTVPLHDIITVKLKCSKKRSKSNFSNIFTGNYRDPVDQSATGSDTSNEKDFMFLTIFYAKRLENSQKYHNHWRKNTVTLYNGDHHIIKLWYETIKKHLATQKRPKCILLFINPFGGKKQALNVYKKFAKPLMNLADIDVNCVISQRHNQIRDIIMSQSLDTYDAVCCVGGDGTFAEVFNGLIFRAIKDLNMDPLRPDFIPRPKIPIGIIPAGSTNTVAYCMHGTTDVRTSVIHIILGQTRGLDLSSFYNNNGLVRFYASVMSYGYLGDVALESEKFRWMGPKRYDYSGFKKLLLNEGYEGEIVYCTQQPTDNESTRIKCTAECIYCLNAQKEYDENKAKHSNYNGYALKAHECHNNASELIAKTDESKERIGGSEWKNVKGKFFMISSANICCASSRSLNGLSPYCHLGDGYIDIVLVRHTNIANNIRLLLTLVNQKGDIANLPFVEIHRTRKFYFRTQKLNEEDAQFFGSCQPIRNPRDNNRTSQWNCDGEVIHDSDIFINSHCQLIDVYMRGPNVQKDDTQSKKCFKSCVS